MAADLDDVDRAILNAFQGGFPVVERPFDPAVVALREHGVDVSEDDLVERVQALDDGGTISRFGALIDAQAIGGTATLVAMHAPAERFDAVAEQILLPVQVARGDSRRRLPGLVAGIRDEGCDIVP